MHGVFVLPLTIPSARKLVRELSASVEPLRELLAGEKLDSALELPLQTRRGLLARLAEALVQGLHRDLRGPLPLAPGPPRPPPRLAHRVSLLSSSARRRSSVCDSTSSSASVTAWLATRSSSSRRRITVF